MTERLLCKIKFDDISRASCLASSISHPPRTAEGSDKIGSELKPKNVGSNYTIHAAIESDFDGWLCAIYTEA
jgi:hypothetical protein